MGYTYLNLLDSPALLQILVALTAVIKPFLPNFLGRAIVILNFLSKDNLFDVYFTTLQLVLVPCGGGRTPPRTLP